MQGLIYFFGQGETKMVSRMMTNQHYIHHPETGVAPWGRQLAKGAIIVSGRCIWSIRGIIFISCCPDGLKHFSINYRKIVPDQPTSRLA